MPVAPIKMGTRPRSPRMIRSRVKFIMNPLARWYLTNKKFKDQWVGVVPRVQGKSPHPRDVGYEKWYIPVKAGLAAPYDLRSEPWSVTDVAIMGPAPVNAQRRI